MLNFKIDELKGRRINDECTKDTFQTVKDMIVFKGNHIGMRDSSTTGVVFKEMLAAASSMS